MPGLVYAARVICLSCGNASGVLSVQGVLSETRPETEPAFLVETPRVWTPRRLPENQ